MYYDESIKIDFELPNNIIENIENLIKARKENKKSKYSLVEKSARSREYKTSIDWLISSNMSLKCQ